MKIEFDNALNEAGWVLVEELRKFGVVNGHMFNNIKPSLKLAIERYLSESDKTQPITQHESQMNIDNLTTQTQEEKEALDSIKPVHLRDYQKVEWKNGDEVEVYGKAYKYVGLDPFNENLCICLANRDDDPQCFSIDTLKKPESPEAKEKRERLEAAYDLFVEWQLDEQTPLNTIRSFNSFSKDKATVGDWLRVVDKTNYRKEQ